MSSPRPYLAFELDALPAASMAATALGIRPGDVAWGLLQLWQWCWRQKKEVVSDTAVQLAFGPDARVGLVLAEAGFLEALPDGQWRVRGASRYLRVSEQRSGAGRRRSDTAKRDARGRMMSLGVPLDGSLDDEDTNSSGNPASGQRSTSGQPALTASSEQRAPKKLSLQQRFAHHFWKKRAETLADGAAPNHDLGASRLNKELRWVTETDPHLASEAADLFLADPFRRSQDPPCSLLWFSKDRATYLSKAQRNGAAA